MDKTDLERFLQANSTSYEFINVPGSAHTVNDVISKLNLKADQLLKSLLFMRADRPVLVLVRGDCHAHEKKLAAQLGGSIRKATPEEIMSYTGYAIGNVPPVCHASNSIIKLMDARVLEREYVYSGAGSDGFLLKMKTADITKLENYTIGDFAK